MRIRKNTAVIPEGNIPGYGVGVDYHALPRNRTVVLSS